MPLSFAYVFFSDFAADAAYFRILRCYYVATLFQRYADYAIDYAMFFC